LKKWGVETLRKRREKRRKKGHTFLQGISAIPSLLTHLTTEANMTFCCVLQFFTNIATGEEDIRFKTAIISFGVTEWGEGDSRVTSTARLVVSIS
jgi:hypothetical protein